jgi:hypothetical protein
MSPDGHRDLIRHRNTDGEATFFQVTAIIIGGLLLAVALGGMFSIGLPFVLTLQEVGGLLTLAAVFEGFAFFAH